jgi:hypothetical protein
LGVACLSVLRRGVLCWQGNQAPAAELECRHCLACRSGGDFGAPVPTPIITFFVPNGFALVSGYYYDVFSDGGFASQLLPWVVASLVATLAIACAVAFRYLAEGVTSE